MVSRSASDKERAWPATLDELAASIVHEAHQPVAAIITHGGACLRWLAQGKGETQREKARASVSAMIDNALRLNDIIRGLCALATQAQSHRALLDLNEIIERSLPLRAEELKRHAVCLELVLAPEPLMVLGDAGQLQQVILNLASNAIQAMASIHDRARLLRIRSHQADGHAVVTVQDEGPGVADSSIDRSFDGAHASETGGMGIGLTICRSIIDAHHGLIWASSNPDHGATFHFALPVQVHT